MKKQEKPRRCKTCGEPCYGRMCNPCFHGGSKYQLSRHYNHEKRRARVHENGQVGCGIGYYSLFGDTPKEEIFKKVIYSKEAKLD
ncbi:MAG: hypothetical protein NT130_03770 [Candidatus Micrarchaeota archaeon]|nr:hypothetical protein [Candidatus Micrarchaeota archaeon]